MKWKGSKGSYWKNSMKEVGRSQTPLQLSILLIFLFCFYCTWLLMYIFNQSFDACWNKVQFSFFQNGPEYGLDFSLCLYELGFGHMICLMVQAICKKSPSWVIILESEIINIKLSINKSGSRLPKTYFLHHALWFCSAEDVVPSKNHDCAWTVTLVLSC